MTDSSPVLTVRCGYCQRRHRHQAPVLCELSRETSDSGSTFWLIVKMLPRHVAQRVNVDMGHEELVGTVHGAIVPKKVRSGQVAPARIIPKSDDGLFNSTVSPSRSVTLPECRVCPFVPQIKKRRLDALADAAYEQGKDTVFLR
jgi:hypothetical protein